MHAEIKPEEHLGLVKAIALRYLNRGLEYDDIYQIGCVGLLKAIDNFDETLGYKFSTYAFNLISGEIKMFLRNNSAIKISRKLRDIYLTCITSQTNFINKEGREQSINELSQITGYSKSDILDAIEANSKIISIYEKNNDDQYIIDFLSNNEKNSLSENFEFEDMISVLDEKSRYVLRMRIKYEKTQKDISKDMNLSQVQISRIEKAAINKLKSIYL